jgi:hypothetical protein
MVVRYDLSELLIWLIHHEWFCHFHGWTHCLVYLKIFVNIACLYFILYFVSSSSDGILIWLSRMFGVWSPGREARCGGFLCVCVDVVCCSVLILLLVFVIKTVYVVLDLGIPSNVFFLKNIINKFAHGFFIVKEERSCSIFSLNWVWLLNKLVWWCGWSYSISCFEGDDFVVWRYITWIFWSP